MNRNKNHKKIVAVATATSLVMTSLIGCQSDNQLLNTSVSHVNNIKEVISSNTSNDSSTAKRDGVMKKEETVYVKADASGTTKSIIVSNWLKNGNGSTVIDDISNLKDIVNVKGEEAFTASGDTLKWAANGADIYYQGTIKEELPVQLKITYTLDGKELPPTGLLGKSGHIKICLDYTNNQKQTITVDGKSVSTVVPFAVLGGTLLDSDKFTNVTVTNGKVVSDGNNTIVAGIALPGLEESLIDGSSDLLKEVTIPSSIIIEADVTDCELGMTLSVVVNNLFGDMNLDKAISGEDIKSKLSEITTSYNKIVDGAKELSGYMKEFSDGTARLNEGANKLVTGSPKLKAASSTIKKGIESAKDGSGKLVTGAKKLYNGASSLSDYTSQVASGVTATKDAIDQLVAAYKGNSKQKGLKQGANELSVGATAVDTGVTDLNKGLDGMYKTITSSIATNKAQITLLSTIAAKLQAGIALTPEEQQILANATSGGKTLETSIAGLMGANQALEQIKAGIDSQDMMNQVDTLNAGTTQLANGATVVAKGVTDMYTANVKLQSGLVTLQKGADGVNAGTKEVQQNLNTLYQGNLKLDRGLKTLDTGYSKFKDALLTYSSGVDTLGTGISKLQNSSAQLKGGAETLYDGTKQFKEEAIDKIADLVNDNFDVIKEKLTALIKADEAYKTYSGANMNMGSTVKFIIETDKISTEK